MKSARTGTPVKHVKILSYGSLLPSVERLERIYPGHTQVEGKLTSGNHYTFCYSSRGWQTWYVGKDYCLLPQGHFLLVKPGRFFGSADKVQEGSRVFILSLTMPDRRTDSSYLGFDREERERLFSLIDASTTPLIRLPEDVNHLWERIYRFSERIMTRNQSDDILDKIRLENLFRELLFSLAGGDNILSNPLDTLIDSILPRFPKGGYSLLIEKAIGHMSENHQAGLTLLSLADGVNISLSRFKARFREETGMDPLDFFTRLSIQKGMELLRTTSWSVRSIAEQLGFSSSPYFSGIFENIVGMGPEEFRAWKDR